MLKVFLDGRNVTSVPRLSRRHRLAVAKFHEVFLTIAPDRQAQPGRQRIDDRDANAMQSTGNLVGVLIEFSAGMKLRHNDLGGGDAFALMDVGRYAATVVANGAGAVRVEDDDHFFGETGKRFVDRVVDDLVDHVMQAGAVIGVADIHPGPLADRVQTAKHFDRLLVVGRIFTIGGAMAIRGAIGRADRCNAVVGAARAKWV
jgi:hypothetical protein